MESRRKRSRGQIVKWICYALLGLLCAVLQTTPGLFQFEAAKPLWLLPLALAVAVFEGEFAGAVFGAVCGLMWDWLAGRTVGAFVEFAPGKEGMVHISKIAKERINRVEDVLTLGDEVKVICLGKDKMGRISFSIKDVPEEA